MADTNLIPERCPDGHDVLVPFPESDEKACPRCGRVWTGRAIATGAWMHRWIKPADGIREEE